MGGMSASDAAPLPRLGEVFFDVRGNSRSMRLSWYADTGVAVLSIWQGGMCTGTFRLAIADLPRMVEILQRGPAGQRRDWDAEVPGEVFAQVPRMAAGPGPSMEPPPGQQRPDHIAEQAEYRTGPAPYQAAQHQTAQHQTGEHRAARHLAEPADPRTRTAAYAGGPPGHRAAPSGPPAAAPEYLADFPDGPRTGMTASPDYLADLPDAPGTGMTGPPEHLADLPDGPRTGMTVPPPEYLPAPPDWQTVPPGHRAASSEWPTTPPGPASKPPDPLTGPAPDPLTAHVSDPLTAYVPDPLTPSSPGPLPGSAPDTFAGSAADAPTGPGSYQAQPAGQRTEYLADLPHADPAGRASYDSTPNGGVSSGASFPPDGASGSYPRGTGRQALADQPYPGSTGPMDYPGTHYPPGTSGPGPDGVPGQETADYPVPYRGAMTDDILPDPELDPVPYDRPQGRRRAASRHAAPDVPFD
jgi:hypothetical protein